MSASNEPSPPESVSSSYTCKICGKTDSHIRRTLYENMFQTKEAFEYFECSSCHCLQMADPPSDLGQFYPSNYYSFGSPDKQWKPPPKFRAFLKQQHARRELGKSAPLGAFAHKRYPHWAMPKWLTVIKPDFDDPILDIGSGSGLLLLELRERGFTKLTGVDPFLPGDIVYPNAVAIYKREAREMKGPYKVVYANHVFEHLPNPLSSLRDFASLAESGAYVVLIVPVFPNGVWERYGVNWVHFDAPRHLFLHNENTIKCLASESGLSLQNVIYGTTEWSFTASEGYVRGLPIAQHDPSKYLTTEQIFAFKTEAADLNSRRLGDQAAFILRKP